MMYANNHTVYPEQHASPNAVRGNQSFSEKMVSLRYSSVSEMLATYLRYYGYDRNTLVVFGTVAFNNNCWRAAHLQSLWLMMNGFLRYLAGVLDPVTKHTHEFLPELLWSVRASVIQQYSSQ